MSEFLNGRRLGWILTVVGAFQLTVVVADRTAGNGFDVLPLVLGLFLLPEGLHQLARSYGNQQLAQRFRTITGCSLTLAGVALWSVLISDWAAGAGTRWWILLAALLFLGAGVLALAGLVAKRRSARAWTSGRMGA